MLTPEIIEARRGNLTASQAHRMMAGWDTPRPTAEFSTELYDWIAKNGKPLVGDVKDVLKCDTSGKSIAAAYAAYQYDQPSKGLLTYAEELACAELFEHDPMTDVQTKAMEYGNEREPEAAALLIERTGIDFLKTGDDQIHVAVDGIGCTPDGIAYDDLDLIVTGAEIKARTPLKHAQQLFIVDNESLLEHDFDRYCQMQVSMEVCGCDEWYCVSYNPHALNPLDAFHYCIIKRDEKLLSIFRERAKLVFEHKAYFLDQIESRRQLRVAA